MHNFDSFNVVQTWQSAHHNDARHTGYRSTFEYRSDANAFIPNYLPPATDVVQTWHNNEDAQYSTINKSFYGVVPYNTQAFLHSLTMASFNVSPLPQTDVLAVNESRLPLSDVSRVSLSETVKPLIPKMGAIYTSTGKNLGTCTLIAENLVMMARHAIEGELIQNLLVTFGNVKYKGSYFYTAQAQLDYVVEDDPKYDYAIVKLKQPLGKELGYVALNATEDILPELALLHYPLGKPLKVSVHAHDQPTYHSYYFKTFHDSDYFSSGGCYIDPLGRFTAMHLGAQLDGDKVNVCRYAISLREIVTSMPSSLLAQLANGLLSQTASYTSPLPKGYLEPYLRDFLIDEEGYQSKKILTDALKTYTDKKSPNYDKRISKNKGGVALSEINLKYIQGKYPKIFKNFLNQCLYHSNLHKVTKQFSIVQYIESDHTIPYDVWNSTINAKMQNCIQGGGGKRPGENDLPAITILYDKHRDLLTTGSSKEADKFRKRLVNLCDNNLIDQALVLCFKEYEAKGIKLKPIKASVIKSLDEHVNLGVITAAQQKSILSKLFKKVP